MTGKSNFMLKAIELSIKSAKSKGGPFGAVIVKNNQIISEGFNQVTLNNDPTAHAEIVAIRNACKKLGAMHKEHVNVYGAHNEERLTGLHETCSIKEFRYGVSDRGASIRIPMQTAKDGYGYLEDRRPSANMDPYQVCRVLIETVCSDVNHKSKERDNELEPA